MVTCEVTGNPSVSDTATKEWTYTPVATTLVLLPESDTNPVGTTHNLVATVYDQFGYEMEGVAVTWNISGVGSFSGSPEGVTDGNGEADAVITSSEPGISTVTCEVTGNPSVSDTATKEWTLEVLVPTTLELTPPSATNILPGETSHEFTVMVKDQHGDPMAGQNVSLETTFGTLSVDQVTTGVDGTATFTISSNEPGTATITVTLGDLTDTATKTWTLEVPVATTLELWPPADTNLVGTTHTLTATVYDQFDNVMAGVAVTWNMTGVGTFVGTPESVTNSAGKASAVITSNVTGISTVTCEVTGNPSVSDTATKTWTTTTPGGGGVGVGGGVPLKYLTVDWDENITKKPLYRNDRLAVDLLGPSPDGKSSLLLERGTLAPTVNGKRHYVIVIRELELEEIPPLPENTTAIMAFNVTPVGAVFDKDIFLTLGFDQLPEHALNATMDYYDDINGVWVPLDYEAGGPNGVAELTLSAPINHFSIFGILVELAPTPTPPSPAHFVPSGLSIVTSVERIWEPVTFVTKIGESVTITANVLNDGGQEGTYTVELKLNGETVDTKTVTLGAGQSQPVSFTVSGLDYGQYEVEVAGLSGDFTTSRTITWWLIIVIIVAIGLIIGGVVWGSRRKRRAA
jgi:adhesin/invasin